MGVCTEEGSERHLEMPMKSDDPSCNMVKGRGSSVGCKVYTAVHSIVAVSRAWVKVQSSGLCRRTQHTTTNINSVPCTSPSPWHSENCASALMHLSFTDSRKYVFNMITPCKIQVSDLSRSCKVRMNHNLYSLITPLPGMHESQSVCIHHTTSMLPSPFYMRDHSTSLASVSVSLIPLRRIHPTLRHTVFTLDF